MRFAAAIAVGLLCAVVVPAGAGDIYVWRDHAGVSHYTTDRTSIPKEYRELAAPVAREWERAKPPPEPAREAEREPRREEPEEPAEEDLIEGRAFDAGFEAGMLAVRPPPAPVAIAVASAPRVDVYVSEAPRYLFGPVFRHVDPSPHETRDTLLPPTPGTFRAGGPSPVGAAGPSPFAVRR